jgi:Flp pilus assembly protein TadG
MFFRPLIRSIDRLRRCRAGNFASIFALVAPVLLGLTGGAVDLMVFNNQQSAMQNAADAAVLATTREASLKNWSQTEAQSIAQSYVESELANAGIDGSAAFAVKTVIDSATRKVSITLDMDQYHYFLLGYFKKSPQIRVSATAQLSSETPVCMIALDPANAKSLKVVNEAQIQATGCAIHSNSVNSQGLFVEPLASMRSAFSCSSGGFGTGVSVFQPAPTTDCPPIVDPMAERLQPAVGSCDFTNFAVKKKTATISPGVYCNGMAIEALAQVTMKPGVYIINGGTLLARGNGSMTGDGVTIFFTGKDGNLNFDGTSKISLTAPVTGPTAGLLFMQDRAMAPAIYELSSQSAPMLLGTIYLPNGTLKVRAPGKVADKSAFTVVVARSVEVGAQTQMFLNSNYGATDVPVPAGLGPSRTVSLVN